MPDKDRFDAVVECRDVAETIDSNYYKGQGSRQGVERPVAVQCFENNTLNHSEVCHTLSGNHDDRVTDTGTSVVISTNSNGEDVAPTISSCEYKMGQKQKDTGGGYVVSRRGDRA